MRHLAGTLLYKFSAGGQIIAQCNQELHKKQALFTYPVATQQMDKDALHC